MHPAVWAPFRPTGRPPTSPAPTAHRRTALNVLVEEQTWPPEFFTVSGDLTASYEAIPAGATVRLSYQVTPKAVGPYAHQPTRVRYQALEEDESSTQVRRAGWGADCGRWRGSRCMSMDGRRDGEGGGLSLRQSGQFLRSLEETPSNIHGVPSHSPGHDLCVAGVQDNHDWRAVEAEGPRCGAFEGLRMLLEIPMMLQIQF